jgi:hypothetical protein
LKKDGQAFKNAEHHASQGLKKAHGRYADVTITERDLEDKDDLEPLETVERPPGGKGKGKKGKGKGKGKKRKGKKGKRLDVTEDDD